MISVTYRNKRWSIPGNIRVRDLVRTVGLNPETVLALEENKLVHEETMLGEQAEIKLVAVVSGG
jgi:sulfur carrier protein ThiS